MMHPDKQHCGKPTDHPPHGHVSHRQARALSCVCALPVCVCPDAPPASKRKYRFHCPGKMVVEGFEAKTIFDTPRMKDRP
jgi:hypothetical protein